ncbi:hypothetical protein BC835DRAFT_1284298 [Cytidiella melzeri]|nr:hypothetical protein BC835DRAFT_1284298 [Cytidiella melzeri]
MPLRSSTKSSAKLTRPSTTTPGFRPTKRMKPESIEFIKRSGATRVFALWKDDNYFYSGTVHSEMAPNKYFIQFDDSTQAEVEIQSLRACEFKKGDYVYCISKDIDHQVQVVDASKGVSDEVVTVEDEMEEFDVYLSDIKVFGRTIEHQWDDRKLTANKIDPYEKPRPTQSSTPSSQSATSSSTGAGIARGRKMLSKMGFAVTLSNADGSTDLRRGLCRTIESHGGIIVDDWGKLFSMIGTHEAQGKRWLVRKHDVRWIKTKEDLHKVFLLADTSNQKPKFLMALALGIPCVKVDWLHDSVKANEKKQWQSYLLPTGTSERLHARISQLVDLNWGDCLEHLQHIMDNPVAIKIFANMNILCVSPDFVPEKAKKVRTGDMSSDADSKRMIPRIILCMGASTVEAVADTKYARAQNLADHYDYIVIEPDTYPDITSRLRRLENCVPFTWVKECLITGRILPIDDA